MINFDDFDGFFDLLDSTSKGDLYYLNILEWYPSSPLGLEQPAAGGKKCGFLVSNTFGNHYFEVVLDPLPTALI